MAKKIEMPEVVIPPHHQSAPKEHYADRAIKQAAEEIDKGNWSPEPDPELDEAMSGMRLALGAGTDGVAIGKPATEEDFTQTEMMNLLGRHPRVVEALDRMQQEVYNPADPYAALERTLAMRELAIAATQRQRWDGQGRWEGEENEKMRYGQILSPVQFYDKLGKVIGKGRVKLGDQVVKTNPEAKSGRVGLYVRNPEWKGEKPIIDDRGGQIFKLRREGEALLRSAKTLRRLGQQSEADKKINLAGEMAEEAMRLQFELLNEDMNRPKEWLRVGVLQWPLGTEWMIMGFTEYGAVYSPKFLGWRTALLTMMRAKAITEREAHKAFPVPSTDAASWYLEQLAMMRNAEGVVQ